MNALRSVPRGLMKKLGAVALIAASLSLIGAQAASAQLLDVGTGDLTAGVFPEDEFSTLSASGYEFVVGGGMTPTMRFAFSAHNGPQGPLATRSSRRSFAGRR